jgi:hypothetical protein
MEDSQAYSLFWHHYTNGMQDGGSLQARCSSGITDDRFREAFLLEHAVPWLAARLHSIEAFLRVFLSAPHALDSGGLQPFARDG